MIESALNLTKLCPLSRRGVVAVEPAIGARILGRKGNAVDAPVPTAFAMKVVEPLASGPARMAAAAAARIRAWPRSA